VSAVEVVDDLIALAQLAEQEKDAARRGRLTVVHDHLAARDKGAKVSEVAVILGLSAPTVRAWIEAGVLGSVPGRPIRVEVVSLAAVKRAVDEIRSYSDDRHLLADVARLLRDRAVFVGADVEGGIEDLRGGRTSRLDRTRLDELLPPPARSKRSSST
jgi:hypothetical protein